MTTVLTEAIWKLDFIVVILLICIGLYCLFAKTNLIKSIIGIEVLAKAVCLCFITGGYFQSNQELAQAVVVTIILIEVIIAAVALSLVVNVYKHYNSVDISIIKRLRG